MKIYAYYLPQFHSIPENDLWWGKGFTEWTNVRKATPLYKGHIQPKHPLNNNYYCLDNVETLEWQSKLMELYKVDGLIFYHYYFTGKKLLEKPCEMLLNNKNIHINYFFCWANHSWYRSWEGSKKLLLEQKYGTKKDWEKHFKYLLPFFKDDRYQKKNNMPLLMVFNSDFEEKKKMFDFFNEKCIENGFDGICVIETFKSYNQNELNKFYKTLSNCTKYVHLREPDSSQQKYITSIKNFHIRVYNKLKTILGNNNFKFIKIYDGNKLFKIMTKKYTFDNKIIRGAFFEWDNTPRHSYRGYIITPPSKSNFMKYMDSIKNDEFLFINAWNEWCEGMMLEPTEENKFKYLEWIKEWKDKNENRINGA